MQAGDVSEVITPRHPAHGAGITGTLLLFGFTGKLTVSPSRLGKWTIAAQMTVIAAVLLKAPFKPHLLLATAILTVLSGLNYVRIGTRLLNAH